MLDALMDVDVRAVKILLEQVQVRFFSSLYPLASFSKLVYIVACYAVRYVVSLNS